ncbi:Hydroxymethylglutaryl-CoA lyase [Polaromonas sp. CG9_12]|nr:Hydroxymethylglutaryl-CoA lyase [Polaromonas sp. CG9_12]
MEVQSALFENNVFLVGQHMMQFAATAQAAAPMPSRISAWGIYDVVTVKDGEQIFLAVVSDRQWAIFCRAFALQELLADPRMDDAAAARAPGRAQRGRSGRGVRGRRTAVCAHRAA